MGADRRERREALAHRRELGGVLERAEADAAARTVPLTISSETPVRGLLGMREILRHNADAVDLSRAARGLPLLIGHDRQALPVGRIEQLTVRDGRLRGIARFGESVRAQEAWEGVVDGIVTDASVGALIDPDDWEQTDERTLTARRWMPVEASLVSIGADPAAGFNRSETMDNDSTVTVSDPAPAARDAEAIAALFRGLDGPKWVTMERDALRAGDALDVVRERVLAALKREAVEPPTPRSDAVLRAGRDGLEKWLDAAEQALDFRFGGRGVTSGDVAGNELAGMSLREMARDYLRVRGERVPRDVRGMVRRAMEIPSLVRATFSHSTSDFTNLLASSSEKQLHAGYMEAPETYSTWTRNVTMTSFRAHSFTALSLFGDLAEVPEGAEYTAGTFSDRAESATLKTYGKLFVLSRQAIVDDDLTAFSDVPMKMGRAAARQVGDLVYSVLTTNTALSDQDGANLFNTTDGNLASSGAAISTTTLDAARTALRTMTDPSGATLNVRPRYLLVPAALETTARVQIASEKDPGEGATTSFDAANPFRNAFDVIPEPRLDANSATAWYLLAAPGAEVETVVVGWLDGRQTPFLEMEEGFTVDGIRHKVRIDCTAKALDWRGMWKNAGA